MSGIERDFALGMLEALAYLAGAIGVVVGVTAIASEVWDAMQRHRRKGN